MSVGARIAIAVIVMIGTIVVIVIDDNLGGALHFEKGCYNPSHEGRFLLYMLL